MDEKEEVKAKSNVEEKAECPKRSKICKIEGMLSASQVPRTILWRGGGMKKRACDMKRNIQLGLSRNLL